MLRSAKRFSSVLLMLAVLLGLLIPAASAAGALTEVQQALNETALSYYYKGACVQYDSTNLTRQGAGRSSCGDSRITSGEPAEFGAPDHTLYSVCSDYCFNIYYDALGYEVMGGPRRCITHTICDLAAEKVPEVVYSWASGESTIDADTAMAEALALCQTGDLVVGYNDTLSSGHAMYFAGDLFGDGQQYMLHCGGKKVDLDTGNDMIDFFKKYSYGGENGGAIQLELAEGLCFGASSRTPIAKTWNRFVIMRPTKAADYKGQLTEHAKSRLKYKGIGVDKNADITVYNSPVQGQDLTITLTVYNHGKEDFYGVTVKEPLPTGATVAADSVTGGGKLGANSIDWTLDIPAEGKVDLTYAAHVTAARGETVTIPAGKVDALDTRSMTFTVSGAKLSEENLAKLTAVTKRDAKDLRASINDKETAFANDFYSKIFGIDLGLPADFNTLLEGLFDPCKPINATNDMWKLKTRDATEEKLRTFRDMGIRDHLVGFAVYTGSTPDELPHWINCVDRTTDYKESFYEVGDVFINLNEPDLVKATDPANVDVYIYMGNDKVAKLSENGMDTANFGTTIGRSYKSRVLLALRPTMAFDDINAVAETPLPFTDMQKADWFYTYVKDLVKANVVNGMTPTTFVPQGNLTYGQALKLVICALGKGEQAPTGDHWASGYLTYAKNENWLDGDVDLNGNISRLSFCRIAAKAKGLTEQPESNPFTDCADADVLALVNAGIINGMTESTFVPDALLTRAQISKIIWCAMQ